MRRDPFQAIADPTRRSILVLLAVQAMTPGALATHFDTSRQAISKHLRILSECELVRPVPHGREVEYALRPDRMQEIDRWLDQFKRLWQQRFEQLDEVLTTLKKERS